MTATIILKVGWEEAILEQSAGFIREARKKIKEITKLILTGEAIFEEGGA